MNQKVNFKLDFFEGPFELLFHLIEKSEINIYDIPIVSLTEQYLLHISRLEYRTMDSMSEFVLMAATLLEIKSKMLLPIKKDESEEEDPRETLVQRLLEYKKFKDAADELKNSEAQAMTSFYRNEPIDLDLIGSAFNAINKDDVSKILCNITLDDLYKAFVNVLNRRELKTDKIRSGFNSVHRDLFTVEEKVNYIKDILILYHEICFHSIFHKDATKPEVIVTFLALLELIKQKEICVEQNASFDEIAIRRIA